MDGRRFYCCALRCGSRIAFISSFTRIVDCSRHCARRWAVSPSSNCGGASLAIYVAAMGADRRDGVGQMTADAIIVQLDPHSCRASSRATCRARRRRVNSNFSCPAGIDGSHLQRHEPASEVHQKSSRRRVTVPAHSSKHCGQRGYLGPEGQPTGPYSMTRRKLRAWVSRPQRYAHRVKSRR